MSIVKFEIETRTVLNEPVTLACECEVFAESPEPGIPAKYYVDIIKSTDHNGIDGLHDIVDSAIRGIKGKAIELYCEAIDR